MTMPEVHRGELLHTEQAEALGSAELQFQKVLVDFNRLRLETGEPPIVTPYVERRGGIPQPIITFQFPKNRFDRFIRQVSAAFIQADTGGQNLLEVSARAYQVTTEPDDGYDDMYKGKEQYKNEVVGRFPSDADGEIIQQVLVDALTKVFSWSERDLNEERTFGFASIS